MKKAALFMLLMLSFIIRIEGSDTENYFSISESLFNSIIKHYITEENHFLFNETYPYNPKNVVTYIINDNQVSKKRVAYLWPTSGVLSGVVSLMELDSGKYKMILDTLILRGLDLYFDETREPAGYQSYISEEGHSDRFYDDNVWLVIDFAGAYLKSHDRRYLERAETTWNFVISGWDNLLDGGIYWCEQRKNSKNTCSNAPSVVAAMKLYEATTNQKYLDWAKKIYQWTKENLQDKSDYLYYDNIKLNCDLGKKKYAYNSGQMMQGAVLLFNSTGETGYLTDAREIAKSCYDYFFVNETSPEGKSFKRFNKENVWFTSVMLRGFLELYKVDKNDIYINAFQESLDYAWENDRDNDGLIRADSEHGKNYKWLLTQAAFLEMYAKIAAVKKN